jgi:hypothetical protein
MDIANNMRASGTMESSSDIWKQITQNKNERFQYLRSVPANVDSSLIGVDTLLVDFKRNFTLPTATIYGQLAAQAKRRVVLMSPYMEHLAARYAHFISRIALPLDHHR